MDEGLALPCYQKETALTGSCDDHVREGHRLVSSLPSMSSRLVVVESASAW